MIRVVAILCLAEALALVGTFAFPALLPTFQAQWSLSNGAAGWISGIYFLGYAVAVPFLSSLTDRIDARRVFIAGAAICAIATLGFALLADGFWSAMALRFLGGIGLAGVYMPGLKALVDRADSPRAISYYTASFSLGTMLSFMVAGEIGQRWGWRPVFWCAGGAAAVSVLLAASLKPVRLPAGRGDGRLLDFRPVLRNRAAMGFILGYAAHSWELFAFRAWMVAFLAFARGPGQAGVSPTGVATICALLGMFASIGGADLAIRFGRRRLCLIGMAASALTALVFGLAAALPYWLTALATMLYMILVMADSAALTTGAMYSADPGRRGATVALHSLIGFGAAFVGPLVPGAVLDAAGGANTVSSWCLAFAAIGLVALLGPVALLRSGRDA